MKWMTSTKWQARFIIFIFVVIAIAAITATLGKTEIVQDEEGNTTLKRSLFGYKLNLVK